MIVTERFVLITFKRNLSLFHDIDPVCQFCDLRNILLHQKDGFALFVYVFDGAEEKSYTEYSQPNPINEYGKTKSLGENYVKDICDRYFIVRTSWLFGKNSKTFISKFLVSENKPGSIDVICDQFASFTYTVDLVDAILLLIKSENYGIFHIVNKNIGSWLDFALKAKEIMKFKTEIKPIKTEELNLPAPRPRYAPLDSKNFEFLFNKSMRKWEDALAEFIKSVSKSSL